MHIADAELDGGAVWGTCKPEIQVFAVFPSLKEEDVVARVEVSKCIQGRVVVVGGLSVELGVFVCMREERMEVSEKMSMSNTFSKALKTA